MRALGLIGALLCPASIAEAGAWARDEGGLFIAAGGNFLLSDGAQLPVHYDPTLYAEYGLSPSLTVGLNFYTADAGAVYSGLVFGRIPLGNPDGVNRHAVSLAFGLQRPSDASEETIMQAGYSWGRGLDHGWLAVDALSTVASSDGTFRTKADITWGRHWSDDWSTIFQLQTGEGLTGDIYAKISPAVIYNYAEGIKIHLGAVHALTGDRGSALKLETWLEF